MTQDSIHGLVSRALRGSELLVASPATIQKAIEKGEPISEVPPLSIEAAINRLFDQRREHALSLASTLLPCPILDTPILYLYDQIRLCILFKLNGAAITFCGILVEYALKYTTYARENPGITNFDSAAGGAFEEITLGQAITRARKAGLIDKQKENDLRAFANDFRNKYSHFNIQEITKGAVFGKVKEKNFDTGEEKIIELAPQSQTWQIIAKDKMDEMNVINVFKCADIVVKHLFVMLSQNKTI